MTKKRNGNGESPPPKKKGNGFQPGQSGNPAGRKPGIKEKLPRGSIRRAFLHFLKHADGFTKMQAAIDSAITGKGKLALGYMRLGAQVIDRIDHERKMMGSGAMVIFNSSLNPLTLRMGLPAPVDEPDEDREDE